LWNIINFNLEDYCIAWKKSLRRLWSLPYNSSQLSTALTSSTIQLFDEISHRITNLCLHCDSHFIRSVVLHGISCKYHLLIHQSVKMRIFALCITTLARFKRELSTELLDRANALREAILIWDNIFALSNAKPLKYKWTELSY